MLKFCWELSLNEVEQEVHAHLAAGQLAGALNAVRDAVDTVINNPRSVARIYASEKLDKLCEQIARSLENRGGHTADDHSPVGGTVIMATELAAAGGHVEVIKDLVRLQNTATPIDLLLTDNFERLDEKAHHGYAASIGAPLHIAKGANSAERLDDILRFLSRRRPHTLVLLVHNQDATGVVAALSCEASRVLFVHHGDHHLSLGVTCRAFTHVDLSNFAFFNCRNQLGLTDNRFWPLTLASNTTNRHDGVFVREGAMVTCCVGRPEKFDDPTYAHQYLDLIGLILKTTGGRHVHIGALNLAQLHRMQQSLAAHGIEASRLTHIPWVSSVSRALCDNNVDLYMTSFPYGGGKAQVEAMATGLPVMVHKNYRSRFLSGIDIGYPGTLQWSDEAELQGILSHLTPATMAEHGIKARAHFEQHHSEDALRLAMQASFTRDEDVPPLALVHNDGLQAFLDEERFVVDDGTKAELSQLRDTSQQQAKVIQVLSLKKQTLLNTVKLKLQQLVKRQ